MANRSNQDDKDFSIPTAVRFGREVGLRVTEKEVVKCRVHIPLQ